MLSSLQFAVLSLLLAVSFLELARGAIPVQGGDFYLPGRGPSGAVKEAKRTGHNLSSRAPGDDPQSSLTLNETQVQQALTNSGLNASDPALTASLTSENNFINFCMTQDVALTNGAQNANGSCNPTPMGRLLARDKMPSSKFKYPKNGSLLIANTTFTVQLTVRNFETGLYSNAETNFFSAPQTTNADGFLRGHSHIVIEKVASYTSEEPLDPSVFTFFKAMNAEADNNVLSVTVTNGLQPGVYRLASISTAINHQPVLIGVAQHGHVDDMVYFRVASGVVLQ